MCDNSDITVTIVIFQPEGKLENVDAVDANMFLAVTAYGLFLVILVNCVGFAAGDSAPTTVSFFSSGMNTL